MAKDYPKFLVSKVNNNKANCYYITHLLHPICLFKFKWKAVEGFTLEKVKDWGEPINTEELEVLYKRILQYASAQINMGNIVR
jgi:hypothetical protein